MQNFWFTKITKHKLCAKILWRLRESTMMKWLVCLQKSRCNNIVFDCIILMQRMNFSSNVVRDWIKKWSFEIVNRKTMSIIAITKLIFTKINFRMQTQEFRIVFTSTCFELSLNWCNKFHVSNRDEQNHQNIQFTLNDSRLIFLFQFSKIISIRIRHILILVSSISKIEKSKQDLAYLLMKIAHSNFCELFYFSRKNFWIRKI